MAEASPPGKKMAQPAAAPDVISESNIAEVEKEALERVSRAISILEDALAKWEASSEKPDEMKEEVERYRRLLEQFSGWERGALIARGSGEDFKTRLGRLKEFIAICRGFEGGE